MWSSLSPDSIKLAFVVISLSTVGMDADEAEHLHYSFTPKNLYCQMILKELLVFGQSPVIQNTSVKLNKILKSNSLIIL